MPLLCKMYNAGSFLYFTGILHQDLNLEKLLLAAVVLCACPAACIKLAWLPDCCAFVICIDLQQPPGSLATRFIIDTSETKPCYRKITLLFITNYICISFQWWNEVWVDPISPITANPPMLLTIVGRETSNNMFYSFLQSIQGLVN